MKKLAFLLSWTLSLLLIAGYLTTAQAKEITIGQSNKTFVFNDIKVKTMALATGDTIHFLNLDPWFHNIFSLTDSKTFDLGSYPKGESRAVKFDAKGIFEVECAIHPSMFMEVTVK